MTYTEQAGWAFPPVPERKEGDSDDDYRDRRLRHLYEHWIFREMIRKDPAPLSESARRVYDREIRAFAEFFSTASLEDVRRFLRWLFETVSSETVLPEKPHCFGNYDGGTPDVTLGTTIPRKRRDLSQFFFDLERNPFWFDQIGYFPGVPKKELSARIRYGQAYFSPEQIAARKGNILYQGKSFFNIKSGENGAWIAFSRDMLHQFNFSSEEEMTSWFCAGAPKKRKKPGTLYVLPERESIRTGRLNTRNVSSESFFGSLRIKGEADAFRSSIPKYVRQFYIDVAWDSVSDLMEATGLDLQDFSLQGNLKLRFDCPDRTASARHRTFVPDGEWRYISEIQLCSWESASCMAHEWWHFAHYHLATFELLASEDGWTGLSRLGDAVMHSAELAGLRARSIRCDKDFNQVYYFTLEEMLARLFEGYIFFRLKEKGITNTNLLSPPGRNAWINGNALPDSTLPTEEEVMFITPFFDEVFRSMKENGILCRKRKENAPVGGQLSFL